MAFDLGTFLGGGVGELFSKIIGAFKLSPEKAAEMAMLKEQHAIELDKIDKELTAKLQDAVSREVEVASGLS